jgi:hypothetical protein
MEVGPTGAQFGHSDPTDTRYAAHYDGAEIVRRCVAAKSQYLVIWARDGDYAYYDSRLLPKAPGLAGRDPLREAVAEAKKHAIPVIAYCVVQQGGHYLDAHPEWEMRGADGKTIGRFCLNSGYLEAMKRIVTELLTYGIDGFHIDMLDQGFGPPYGCYCNTCRGIFEKKYGNAMPAGPTWDDTWDKMLEFRYFSSERFEKELALHIKALNPAATVDFNYHGNPPFSFEVGQRPVQHAANGDFVTGETGVWGFSALGVGLNAEFYRASTPGLPFQVAMQRGVRTYHDQTTRPLQDIRWELFTLLAHGAFVTMVDKTAFDGRLDPVAYDRISAAFDEARRKREHFGHQPVYEAGLYYSSRSRDWMGRERPGEWMQAFLGGHKALTYEQIPCGVILDENLTLESLQRFPVVILSNAGILSDHELVLIREYVENGHGLIVTGHSGQFDRLGRPVASQAMESLVGARALDRLNSLDNWVRFPANTGSDPASTSLLGDLRRDWAFLIEGPATRYKATTAKPVGELLRPHRTHRQREGKEGTEWPMSPDEVVGPAVLLHRLGKGMVITFTGSPDIAAAGEHHLAEARRLLTRAVRMLNPAPCVRIAAPANIQSVITDERATRTLRIHFLGYNTPPQTTPSKSRPYVLPTLIEAPPIFHATIDLADEPRSVRALNSSTMIKSAGRRIDVTIEDVHEVLIVRY